MTAAALPSSRERLLSRLASSRAEYAILTAIVAISAVITWYRVPADHRDRVWAEDANIFLEEGVDQGPWAVIFQGYAGYQHLVPRMVIAFLLPVLDLEIYPVVIFAICAVLTGLVAGAVFWLSRDLVPWIPARVGLGLVTAVLPLAAQETVGNLADLHTYAMWLVPWLLLYRPRSWGSSVGWAVVSWAVVMTEIQAIFFVFLLPFRLRRADRRQWPVFGAFLIGAAVQVATALLVERKPGGGPLSIASTVYGWLINTVMPLVSADPLTLRSWLLASGPTVALIILVPIVISTVIVLVWGDSSQRLLCSALLLGSAAVYTGSAWANSGFWFMYAEEPLSDLGIRLVLNIRYGVASGMMLVAVIFIAAAVLARKGGSIRLGVASVACVATIAVLSVGATTAVSYRDQVGVWSAAARDAVTLCSSTDPPREVTLPVAPDRSVDLSCDQVLQYSR